MYIPVQVTKLKTQKNEMKILLRHKEGEDGEPRVSYHVIYIEAPRGLGL
jgi:hypothetical protein